MCEFDTEQPSRAFSRFAVLQTLAIVLVFHQNIAFKIPLKTHPILQLFVIETLYFVNVFDFKYEQKLTFILLQ